MSFVFLGIVWRTEKKITGECIEQGLDYPLLFEHKFNESLMADVFLPRYAYLRKKVFGNGRLSAGWELDP